MQGYTLFVIVVSALHVSSAFSAHHQELKNCTCSVEYLSNLFAATANVGESELVCDLSNLFAAAPNVGESEMVCVANQFRLTHVSGSIKQV